jgi:hypothetical protein
MQSVYTAMGKVGSNTGAIGGIAPSQTFTWPPATPKTTELMVLLLARELRVQDALSIVKRIRERGMPCNKEVPFGLVVESPLAPGQPLTVCMFTLTGFLSLHINNVVAHMLRYLFACCRTWRVVRVVIFTTICVGCSGDPDTA